MFATLEGPYEMETKAILNVAIASFKTRNPKVTGTLCFGLSKVFRRRIFLMTPKYKQTKVVQIVNINTVTTTISLSNCFNVIIIII